MEKSGVGTPPQEGNLNVAMRVLQLNVPLVCKYSFVYQKCNHRPDQRSYRCSRPATSSWAIAIPRPR